MGETELQEVRAKLREIKSKIRVTKVVCTRSVKGRGGDSYVGFSASWDTIQDDGTHDLESVGDIDEGTSLNAMTLKEAVIASKIVAREADLAAYDHAVSGGSISSEHYQQAIRQIKANYDQLILEALKK
jgi:hypothetical protein